MLDVPYTPIVIPQLVTIMNCTEHEPQACAVPGCTSAESGSYGLLLSRDLIFTTKIKATAAELGYQIQVAREVLLARSLIAEQRPRVVLIDLTAGDLCAPAALCAYRKLAGPDLWFVAFGPHVDADALAKAQAAGCQIAMPRSRFASELPNLIQQYFSHSS
ncbi:MAG: response regulator [Isosphaeraceae bacterium]